MSRVADAARRWRLPALLAVAVIAAGTVVALLQPAPAGGYLDPNGTSSTGSRALADLLDEPMAPEQRSRVYVP